jgi:Tfp pilus assembly protein PilW
MPLPLIVAVALALILVGAVGARFWAVRSRRRPDAPVTEAEARAHALPLTKSVLSVRARPRAGGRVDLDG